MASGMIEYDDGTPASAPQMAHDVSEYLLFVSKAKVPDQRVMIYMALAISLTVYPISYLFTKYHFVNCHSHRLELYAVKNGGYKKFREKAFRTHKIPGNWLGQYS
jgi:ubiquinol-cytochrome c reductase cytochrome c1 subunit